MPTLLAALGAPAPDVPGRNLLVVDFDPKIVYFHKLAEPETWGLRDGRWKYIGEIRSGAAQLYDLAADPAEHNNLAPQEAERVARYSALCRSWYLQSDREYTLRLKDYQTVDDRLTAGDRLGARILSSGYLAKDKSFIETTVVNPKQAILAWVKWTRDPLPSETTEWVSPSGKTFDSKLGEGPEFHVTLSAYPGPMPMEEGDWTIRLRESDGVHLTQKFAVRPNAAVHTD